MEHSSSIRIDPALARLLAWTDGIDLPMFVLLQGDGDRIEFIHVNAAFARVVGMPRAIFPGQTSAEIFPARIAHRLEGSFRSALRATDPVSYAEAFQTDSREIWWQTTLSKPAEFEGRVILGIAVPITDQKEREFAAVAAMADLQSRFEDLKLFSTMAAHDARGPLATASSLIELVLKDFADTGDGKGELLRLCARTIDEGLSQITATLEQSRRFDGSIAGLTQVDLGQLCDEVAAMVDPALRLDIAVPDAVVRCDRVVMQMGIRNLVTNAERFCRGRIAVSLGVEDGFLTVDVADDGPGIARGTTLDDLSSLGMQRGDSHGVGLESLDAVLRSRGGRLEIVEGGGLPGMPGACFRMTLPGERLEASGQDGCQPADIAPTIAAAG